MWKAKISVRVVTVAGMLGFAAHSAKAQCVNGLTLDQLLSSSNDTFCSVTPSALCVSDGVPTVSTWGLVVTGILILLGATLLLRKRSRRAAFSLLCVFLFIGSSYWAFSRSSVALAHNIQTSLGNLIAHHHRPRPNEREFTDAEKTCINDALEDAFPNATRTGEPTITTDCHGETFDDGNCWINDEEVQQVLDDDYVVVAGAKQVGDIVVYRDADGNITHSGTVTAVDGNGNVTEVESKWGSGGKYKHAVDETPYGTNIEYYR